MSDDAQILAKLKQASRRIRLQRAVTGAVRAALLVHLLLIPWLLVKQVVPLHPEDYLLVLFLAAAIGILVGLLAPLPLLEVARRLDARLALQERLQSALEFRHRRELPVIGALIEDAAATTAGIKPAAALSLAWPPEIRYLLPALLLAAALLWLPAPPIPGSSTTRIADAPPEQSTAADIATEPEPAENPATSQALPRKVQRQPWEELQASFKDTPFATQPPDFVSFLKGGDDRLSLLGPSAELADLQRDHIPYRVSVGRRQQGQLAFDTQQFSREEATERMEELEKLWGPGQPQRPDGEGREAKGQVGENASNDEQPSDREGAWQIPSGQKIEDPKGAPRQLREQGGTEGKRFGGLQYPHDAPGGGLPPWLQGPRDPGFQDAGTGSGASTGKTSGQPGVGHSLKTKGPQTPRIDVRSEQDLRLDGQLQEGDQDSYDTDLPGPGAKIPSRLPYLEQRAKYARMAEETLSKERVPFAYRERVKRYFSAIEGR